MGVPFASVTIPPIVVSVIAARPVWDVSLVAVGT